MTSDTQNQPFDRSVTDGMERSFSNRRVITETALTWLAFLLMGIAILPLVLVLGYVAIEGGSRFNLDLFTEGIPVALQEGGGLGPAIYGSLIVVGIATLISVPFGILAAVYLSEFSSGRIARWVRFATNILSGVPSIIVGLFAYGVIVLATNTFSAWAGGFALAILMLPIIVRTTDEALQLVPEEVRWASVGVGASNFQTVLRVVLPAATGAAITGVVLGVARAAGETAPLIFTALFTQFWPRGLWQPIPTLSVLIYNFASVPYDNLRELAWTASLLLVLLILLASILARFVARRSVY